MTPFGAWRDGIRRVGGAPAVLIGAWTITVLVSVPLAAAMRSAVSAHLGESLAADTAASGVNYEWMQEFSRQASGMGVTLGPAVIGFGIVLDNMTAFADLLPRPVALIGAAAVYVMLWVALAGGVIDRFARGRATHAHGFFAACGVFFFRFLRLGVLMGAVYGLLFRYLHPWLFTTLYPRLTHELTVERTAFFIQMGLYAVFGLLLAACNILFDYAKVRAVVEDRRSMIGATLAGARFIVRNYPAVLGLYLMDMVLFVAVLAVYAALAPGAGDGGWSMWIGLAIGQLYVLARLWVKLVFWASETALFQGRLAHAGYVAAPLRAWPDSPMADALSSPDSLAGPSPSRRSG